MTGGLFTPIALPYDFIPYISHCFPLLRIVRIDLDILVLMKIYKKVGHDYYLLDAHVNIILGAGTTSQDPQPP